MRFLWEISVGSCVGFVVGICAGICVESVALAECSWLDGCVMRWNLRV